jgi:hypothetical protein
LVNGSDCKRAFQTRQNKHYEHGEPILAEKEMHQISISFDVADCPKVSPDLVHDKSINYILKLVL